MLNVVIDDVIYKAHRGELLVDLIGRTGGSIPHVCYHPQLGPIKTCDTCMVEVNGQLVRACTTTANEGMKISTRSSRASAAQVEAFDRILSSHLLYCTVCDNNNGNCTIHNTTKLLAIEHQRIPFQSKPYEVDSTNPFYRYDPDQCILCGRCVEACQNVEVNETLSINWKDPHPRVLWDGGSTTGESSPVSCGHCVTVCPAMRSWKRPCSVTPELVELRYNRAQTPVTEIYRQELAQREILRTRRVAKRTRSPL